MASHASGHILSTILKHDAKVTSYKIALLRAINDVVLSFPDLRGGEKDLAVPLRLLAEFWVAYYWPFVEPQKPIRQGPLSQRANGVANDMAFRPLLSQLRLDWEKMLGGVSRPSDGFFLIHELRVPHKQSLYPQEFRYNYQQTLRAIAITLQMPIRYAGPGQWSIFDRPRVYAELHPSLMSVPGTRPDDRCLVIRAPVWQSFYDLSLWIEALCIHEWCLFSESVPQGRDLMVGRGTVYELLTDRPDNRRPLTWERNNVDMLLMEGRRFICPWTEKPIHQEAYALDHVIPVSIYAINELWNLVPSDPAFNSHVKSNRLPSPERLVRARPHLAQAYLHYQASKLLSKAIYEDVAVRFSVMPATHHKFATSVADAVTGFTEHIAQARNLTRF